MKNSTISVIATLNNNANCLLRALRSAEAQTYAAKEIIVVNDGSTGSDVDMIKAAGITNLKIISQSQGGISKARNTGIAAAKGEYMAFLDADCEWMPMFLEQMMDLVYRFPVAGAFASRYQFFVDEKKFKNAKINGVNIAHEGGLLDDFFDVASRGDLPFVVSSMLVRKDTIYNAGGFPEDEPMGEDQDFMCRIADRYHVAYSNNINALLHTRQSESIDNVPSHECPFSQRIMQRIAQQNLKPEAKASRLRFCATHISQLAKRNLQAGNVRVAWRLLNDERMWTKPVQKLSLMLSCFVMLPLARS